MWGFLPGLQVWAYQGNKTLAYYLKRRDCMDALARDMCVAEEVVVPTVMRHIFQCLEVRAPAPVGVGCLDGSEAHCLTSIC